MERECVYGMDGLEYSVVSGVWLVLSLMNMNMNACSSTLFHVLVTVLMKPAIISLLMHYPHRSSASCCQEKKSGEALALKKQTPRFSPCAPGVIVTRLERCFTITFTLGAAVSCLKTPTRRPTLRVCCDDDIGLRANGREVYRIGITGTERG
jgi:hypothetical protein